ncbi:MAG TPA: amino acid ABC transporter permease [Solirubrobacteraceae bacterium]|nr:amino acid ABC transporter permease [Solirubrobacteraceae bacterium]
MVSGTIFSDWGQQLPQLLPGFVAALKLTGLSLLVGFPLGLLFALMVMSSRRAIKGVGLALVELGRGVPLLVLLELVYFGMPELHLTVTQLASAVIGFGWSTGAYASETVRASLEAVPRGQRDAAEAVGFGNLDSFRFVIFPQAVRIAIPPLMNTAIYVFQGTSLAFVIAYPEIMSRAYEQGSETFEYLSIFILAACMYAAISLPATLFVGVVERYLGRHLAR